MNRTITILAAGLVLGGPVPAGSVAVARDGRHQAVNGNPVDPADPNDRVGVGGWTCVYPVLRGGRIVPKSCRGNGDREADLEIGSRIEAGLDTYEGQRHDRPTSPARPNQRTVEVDPSRQPRPHAGSIVMVDPDMGVVTYLRPDASLGAAVHEGTDPLRGTIHADEPMQGASDLDRAECPASACPVGGTYTGLDTLTLRGVGLSDRSSDAVWCLSHPLDDRSPDRKVGGMATACGSQRTAGSPIEADMDEEAANSQVLSLADTARQGMIQPLR